VQVTVAHDLAAAFAVGHFGVTVDPLSDLGLDRLGQHPLSSLPQDVAQYVLRGNAWKGDGGTATLGHGGVLLGKWD
jgi:hypothetical protein